MGTKLANLSPLGEVDAWSPTWQPAFKERAPKCEVQNSMADTLQLFVVTASASSDGLPNLWALAFEADIPMATLVQATKGGVTKVTTDLILRAIMHQSDSSSNISVVVHRLQHGVPG